MDMTRSSGPLAVGALAAYNVVQNLVVPERAYVPANLVATAGLVGVARRAGVSWPELGFARPGPGLRLGGIVGGAAAVGMATASAASRTRPLLLDERARGHGIAETAYRSAVRFPLGTALFEEVAFRGVLEALWRRRSGDRSARLVSAVSFGLWHLLPTYRLFPEMAGGSTRRGRRAMAALGGAVITGIAGAGFTWLRERSGSVAAPWLAHAAYNASAYLAARRAWRLEESSPE